jgi:hypothetical protein
MDSTDLNKDTLHTLVKEKVSYSNLEYSYGQKPYVKSFKIIPSGDTPVINKNDDDDNSLTPILDRLL